MQRELEHIEDEERKGDTTSNKGFYIIYFFFFKGNRVMLTDLIPSSVGMITNSPHQTLCYDKIPASY